MRQVKLLVLLMLLLSPAAVPCASAQGLQVVRGGCLPGVDGGDAATRGASQLSRRQLPTPSKDWDSEKIYRQLVILFSFSDTDFSRENPKEWYHQILNEPGYNEGKGPGCMADYFREQSGGLFNLQFDVYGPYQVSSKAQPYDKPNENTRNYGIDRMVEATKQMIAENPDLNFKVYDWNGDGTIEQVIYIFAGIGGNQATKESFGHIWPNTSNFTAVTAPDGTVIRNYSSSAELWVGGVSCGIGTICHEYSHSLGLPDIYPTNSTSAYYSVCDEWDLMDGGNFTNGGWCPPNYTAQEKMLLGWATATELTEAIAITDMAPQSRGGEIYSIHHTDNEYLLLENRQQVGWDLGVPGKGLVIYHVDYNKSKWGGNSVNAEDKHFRFQLVHADNMDYNHWEEVKPYGKVNQYQNERAMNNWHLSSSPFPWSTDSTTFVNSELTDKSTPATVMFNEVVVEVNDTTYKSKLLSKPLTNIQMAADGTVSFYFGGYVPTAVQTVTVGPQHGDRLYNLQGQRVSQPGKGIYIRNGKKFRY